MQAALLTVGDELLDGDTENTNATWLSRQLTERGLSVERVLTVPDDREVIAEATREYSDAFDAVVVTGGLGRTPDDVTMEAVAAAFDRPMVEDEVARADVDRTRGHRGRLPRPRGGCLEGGAAAGWVAAAGQPRRNLARLRPRERLRPPGDSLRNEADVRGGGCGVRRRRSLSAPLHRGAGGDLIERLDGVQRRFDVTVGCYPDRTAGHNRLKITGSDEETVTDATAWLAENVTLVENQ
jgi:molybdopterin-biosynthesis enzyme MoeA-like protein